MFFVQESLCSECDELSRHPVHGVTGRADTGCSRGGLKYSQPLHIEQSQTYVIGL